MKLFYEYDFAMVEEMELMMQSDNCFIENVQIINGLYGYGFELTQAMIMHAAHYAFNCFVDSWSFTHTELFLQPEYFRACRNVIPTLWI